MSKINQVPDFEAMAKSVFKGLAHNVGQKALSHFKGSFRKQGFTDYSFIAWAARKDDLGHKLLLNTNNLMNDVQVRSESINKIEIGTSLPYAGIHNNGGKFSIVITDKMRKYFWAMFKETEDEKWKYMALTKKKRLPIRIPQRQFIGQSQVLNNNIDKLINETILRELKNIKHK